MIKKSPLVSVIIPSFRSGSTIESCLRSIKNQKNATLEIIVVDEFSDDQTANIARRYGKFFQVRGERSVARNFGAGKAHGDYFLFIDSDMELSPYVVAACVKKSAGKKAIVIPELSEGSGFWTNCRILERKCYSGDDIVEAARFFPRHVFESLGGYDREMAGVEDWDLHQRLLEKNFPVDRIKDLIIHHEGTISLSKALKKKYYYGQVFDKYRKRHPEAFRKSFIRTSFLKNFHILAADPMHALGVFVMKMLEGIAILYGMREGMRYGTDTKKHYR